MVGTKLSSKLDKLDPEKTALLLRSISLIGQSLAKLEFHLENATAVFENEAVLQAFAPEKRNASLDSFAKVMRNAAASGRSAVKLQESAALIAKIISETSTTITQLQNDTAAVPAQIQNLTQGVNHLESQLRSCSTIMMDLEKEARSIFDSAEQARLLSLNANIESVRAADKWETDFSGISSSITTLSDQTNSLAQAVALSGSDFAKQCRTALRQAAEALNTIRNVQSEMQATHNACLRLAEETVMLSKSSEEMTAGSSAALLRIKDMAQPLNDLGKAAQSNLDDLRICAENRARLNAQSQALFEARQTLTEFNEALYQKATALAGPTGAKRRDEYCAGFLADFLDLDPATARNPLSLHIIDYLYQSLTKSTGEYASPSLAINWSCNEDFTTWYFTLRPGVRFHNGRAVTADDVHFSLERMLRQSPHARLFAAISGSKIIGNSQGKPIAGLKIVARDRIRFDLDPPEENWPLLLSHPAAAILPKDEYLASGRAFFDNPVGSGPFEFAERDRNTIILQAYDQYCQGRPFVDELKIMLFQELEECLRVFRQGRLEQVVLYEKQYEMVDLDRVSGQVQILESQLPGSGKMMRLLGDRVRWIGAEEGRDFSLTEAWLTFAS